MEDRQGDAAETVRDVIPRHGPAQWTDLPTPTLTEHLNKILGTVKEGIRMQ